MRLSKQAENISDDMAHALCEVQDAWHTLYTLQTSIGNGQFPDICEVFNKETYNTLQGIIDNLTQIERAVNELSDKCDDYAQEAFAKEVEEELS